MTFIAFYSLEEYTIQFLLSGARQVNSQRVTILICVRVCVGSEIMKLSLYVSFCWNWMSSYC